MNLSEILALAKESTLDPYTMKHEWQLAVAVIELAAENERLRDENAAHKVGLNILVADMDAKLEAGSALAECDALKVKLAEANKEVELLKRAAEERECDMHMRIRLGYDKTVADTWRAANEDLQAQLAAMTAARDEACNIAEVYLHSIEGEDGWDYDGEIAELRAVGKGSK